MSTLANVRQMEDLFLLTPYLGLDSRNLPSAIFETFNRRELELELSTRDREVDLSTGDTTPRGVPHTRRTTVTSLAGRPTLVELGPLILECPKVDYYELVWYHRHRVVHRQIVKYPTLRNIVFVSNDLPEAETETPLWSSVVETGPDVVVHLGSNIYADRDFQLVKQYQRSQKEHNEGDIQLLIGHYYGRRYRETFNRWIPELGSVPHLFGIGDHDLGHKRSSTERGVTTIHSAALHYYDLYQGQANGSPTGSGRDRSWVRSWSCMGREVTLANLDRPTTDGLANTTILSQVPPETQLLLVTTAEPPLPCPSYHQQLLTLRHRKRRYHVSDQDVVDLFDSITTWLDQDETREAIVISGGAHFGAIGRVRRRDRDSNYRLNFGISSPITDQPSTLESATAISYEMAGWRSGPYSMVFDEVVYRRNYLTLEIDTETTTLRLTSTRELFPALPNVPGYLRQKWEM